MARCSKTSVFRILGAWVFKLYSGPVLSQPLYGELTWWLEQDTHKAKVRCQTSFGFTGLYCSLVMVCGPRLTQLSSKCLTQSHRGPEVSFWESSHKFITITKKVTQRSGSMDRGHWHHFEPWRIVWSLTKIHLSEIYSSHRPLGLSGALLFYMCSVLTGTSPSALGEGWQERLGGVHCKTKPLGMSWE